MQKSQFKQAYHNARIGQTNSDTLEGLVAIIALQDARKSDLIGSSYRFALDLSGNYERILQGEELKARRKARKNAVEFKFDYSILNEE